MLYGLPQLVIDKLRLIFKADNRIKHVWLYGSRALANQKPASDIDLCVEGATLTLKDLHYLENQLDDLLLPWKIDISLKHTIDNADLLQHIEEDGVNLLQLSQGKKAH